MRTISQAVEEVVQRSPFLGEAMAEGIANNAQIARKIRQQVEKHLLEKVSEAAIAMALHRLQKNLRSPNFGMHYLKRLNDITVRSSLVEFVCPNTAELPELLETISHSARRRKDTFVNFSRGLHESLLIVDEESAKAVETALGKHKHLRIDNLSAVTLRLPESSLNVPGLYYPILKALATEGISFVEVMSVRTEFTILFNDKDIDRAFSVLKKITS